jgi:hypothetical protein
MYNLARYSVFFTSVGNRLIYYFNININKILINVFIYNERKDFLNKVSNI